MSSPDRQETAQNCYTMAYFVLPRYVFAGAAALVEQLAGSTHLGTGLYYATACKMNGTEPDPDLVHAFPVRHGDLDATSRYCVVAYPTPPAVDLSGVPPEELFTRKDKVVLAPYFSAIVLPTASPEVRYFVLGQSPIGTTTLRGVTPTTNANLGSGSEPELEPFLDLLRVRMARVRPG